MATKKRKPAASATHGDAARSRASRRNAEPPPLEPSAGVHRLWAVPRAASSRIGSVAWSPDGLTLALQSEKSIDIWDIGTRKRVRTLDVDRMRTNALAFSPTGRVLAIASLLDGIELWDVELGRRIHTLETSGGGLTPSVAFDHDGKLLAASSGKTATLWDVETARLVRTLKGHENSINSIAFDPSGRIVATGSSDETAKLWAATSGKLVRTFRGRSGIVWSVTFDPAGRLLATANGAGTVNLWEPASGRLLRVFEGHTGPVGRVSFSPSGQYLGSSGADASVRLWNPDRGECVAIIPETADRHAPSDIAFHPTRPIVALAGAGHDSPPSARFITIWQLDPATLASRTSGIGTTYYANAKVVLLGDTGVGKSGLSLVLNGQPFEPTESTAGRRVWTFASEDVELDNDQKQTRETLLWDLAGQPGYRIIHQLHLNEVAVALVIFDARSETDPLAGVRHWERALRLAQQRQGLSSIPLKKYLVSARADRGTVAVSKDRLQTILDEFGFDGYFETSAKEGWQITELQQRIRGSIPWDQLPQVSSSILFSRIKDFILEAKATGRLVTPISHLFADYVQKNRQSVTHEASLREQFETCIGRLENRDLIRRLSFGGYLLLQPELLDAYASAMVNAAKEEPDGLGSISEEAALSGQFYVPKEQRVSDPAQEQLLLHATVEELAQHDLVLRESAADGRHLVFPSQFNRDYEDAPEPKGKALAITFEGPVQSLYATLAVRLGHSGLFSAARSEMWRNASLYTAKAGGKCGLYLHEFAEARGRLVVFYDQHDGRGPSDETRFHFEEFVLAHVRPRALEGSVDLVRFFVCSVCGNPVPASYVALLRERGRMAFDCPCGATVSLAEPKERLQFPSRVEEMAQSADRQRDLETFVESARGETSTPSFRAWAGDDRVTLALVFTDVVGSTALGYALKDDSMNVVRQAHFAQSRQLIARHNGREIKTIGDSFMAAFRSVDKALDYARALHSSPGHPQLTIRAGIHIGPMHVEDNDVFGGAVNYAARVVGAIQGDEIWLSDYAKESLDASGARRHSDLLWQKHGDVSMKGFPGRAVLWSFRPHKRK